MDWCSSYRLKYTDASRTSTIRGIHFFDHFHVTVLCIVKSLMMFCHSQVRKLEFLVAFLVFTIAICFVIELHYSKPDAGEVLHGLFVPQLKGNGATGLAISLLGAMVMP